MAIINLYYISCSSSNGMYYCLMQYNKIDGKEKKITDYRKKILTKIEEYLKQQWYQW